MHIDRLQQQIDGPRERQMRLDGTVEARTDLQLDLQAMEWQQQIKALTEDFRPPQSGSQHALRSAGGVPFVWDIAFVEIFRGEKGGFDIVIGNPPYVRQEKHCGSESPA